MIKILIVDDEAIDRKGVCYLLEKYEFPVKTLQAKLGKQALEILAQQHVDILFTDIRMPHMDGIMLISKAVKLQPHLKVIIYSAYDDFEYAKSAMNYGVRYYLLKPVVLKEFKETLTSVINECLEQEKQRVKNEIAKLFMTGECSWQGQWDYGKSLMLIDFSDSILQKYDTDIFRRIGLEAGDLSLSIALNEYQVFVFYNDNTTTYHLADKLLQYFAILYDGKTTIVLGEKFEEIDSLYEKYELMDNALEKKFFTDSSSIIKLKKQDGKKIAGHSLGEGETEILIYIRRGEKARVKNVISNMFKTAKESGSMSAIYLKYLVVNIARECFDVSNSSKEEISKYMVEIFNCQHLGELQKTLEDIVDHTLAVEGDDTQAAIQKVLAIIKTEYATDISLEQIAERVSLTPSYLSFLFKQETGQTFIKYLTSFRMEKAKHLLLTTGHKINVISELVGYENTSYFGQLFRNYFSVTPMQFRELHLSNGDNLREDD